MNTYEIFVLAEDVATARAELEMIGMQNTFGLNAAERLKLDVRYRVAQARLAEAERLFLLATSAMR